MRTVSRHCSLMHSNGDATIWLSLIQVLPRRCKTSGEIYTGTIADGRVFDFNDRKLDVQ